MPPSQQAPRAYETKTHTIGNTAVAIDAVGWSWGTDDLANADAAVVAAHTNAVNLTYDGTTPTTTTGVPIAASGSVRVTGNASVRAIQLIRSSSNNATASITLERWS